MDSLITVIFFIIVAILSAVLKKKQSNEREEDSWSGESSSPSDRRTAQPPKRQSWEDELKRLLEGNVGRESAPPPPPLPTSSSPPPPPPPVRTPQPSTLTRPGWARGVEARKEEALEKARKLREKRNEVADRLRKSMEHLRHASRLDDRAIRSIRKAADRIHTRVEEKQVQETPGEIKDALAWMKSPASLRSAMVAAIILGPPKSKEFETGQAS
jgi:type IV secretory pathway VirB10-like protein